MADHFLSEDYLNNRQKGERTALHRLEDPNFDSDKVKSGFKVFGQDFTRHYYCSRIYKKRSKNDLFSLGLCYNFVNEVYNPPEEYWLGGDSQSFILMSDNKELYTLMCNNFKGMYSPEYPGYANTKAMFQIACGEWEGLAETKKFVEAHCDKDFWQSKEMWLLIYDAFLKRDVEKLSEVITMLDSAKHKKQRIRNDTIEKYISPRTIAMAKLAWMHGMEVNIDSPYVPKELLPFEPLEEYTIPYKFLRDYYRPLGYSWRYDPVYPELQDWDNDPENPDRNKGGFLKRLFS